VYEKDGSLGYIDPILNELWLKSDEYDAIDRVEITCARLIARTPRRTGEDLGSILAQQLSELPAAIANQLEKLGALRPGNF
jgi:hypothetical protein